MSATFDFKRDVMEASQQKPIVVDFWAEWCAPCRVLGPVLEKLAAETNGQWQLVKVNTEEHPQVAMEYRIQGIPAVKMFSGGEVIAEFVGALPEVQVKKWLDENLPSKSKKLMEEAMDVLKQDERDSAQKLFRQVLEIDPHNNNARIHLAELIFASQPEQALDLVKDIPPEHPRFNQAEALKNLGRLKSDYENLAEKAEQNKSNQAWQDYLSGIRAFNQADYEAALKSWIDAIIVDKTIDDDGPRKACVALFNLLGREHELTRNYHRSFTSALF